MLPREARAIKPPPKSTAVCPFLLGAILTPTIKQSTFYRRDEKKIAEAKRALRSAS